MQIDDEKIRHVLSQNIKTARIYSNLTQEQLAEQSEISLNFLKDIESGRSGTSLLTFINICKSLYITPNELLKDFFQNTFDKSENLIQQMNLLNDYQKNAVSALIEYFNNTEMHN